MKALGKYIGTFFVYTTTFAGVLTLWLATIGIPLYLICKWALLKWGSLLTAILG